MQLTLKPTGYSMPMLGYGTYQLRGDDCVNGVRFAIKEARYRHIDTATVYRNESLIGGVIQDLIEQGFIRRDELFITSKLAPRDQGYESALKAVETSLKALKMTYIDLYLIHWPGTQGMAVHDKELLGIRTDSYRALLEAVRRGWIRHVGVSNYTLHHLQQLKEICEKENWPLPSVLQSEAHPALIPREEVAFCKENGIVFTAYASLGEGDFVRPDGELFQKYSNIFQTIQSNKSHSRIPTVAQILLRWAIQHDWIVIPKATSPTRITENSQLFEFELNESEMQLLDNLNEKKRFCWDPNSIA